MIEILVDEKTVLLIHGPLRVGQKYEYIADNCMGDVFRFESNTQEIPATIESALGYAKEKRWFPTDCFVVTSLVEK